MSLYRTDENGVPIKVAGNRGKDPNKADKDLSNVTYPEIIYDSIEKKFDGVPHTGSADRVVMSYVSSDGLTWYRIWASGWKECGGIVEYNRGGSTKFPISFTVAQMIHLTYLSYTNGTASDTPLKVQSLSPIDFVYNTYHSYDNKLNYTAMGY